MPRFDGGGFTGGGRSIRPMGGPGAASLIPVTEGPAPPARMPPPPPPIMDAGMSAPMALPAMADMPMADMPAFDFLAPGMDGGNPIAALLGGALGVPPGIDPLAPTPIAPPAPAAPAPSEPAVPGAPVVPPVLTAPDAAKMVAGNTGDLRTASVQEVIDWTQDYRREKATEQRAMSSPTLLDGLLYRVFRGGAADALTPVQIVVNGKARQYIPALDALLPEAAGADQRENRNVFNPTTGERRTIRKGDAMPEGFVLGDPQGDKPTSLQRNVDFVLESMGMEKTPANIEKAMEMVKSGGVTVNTGDAKLTPAEMAQRFATLEAKPDRTRAEEIEMAQLASDMKIKPTEGQMKAGQVADIGQRALGILDEPLEGGQTLFETLAMPGQELAGSTPLTKELFQDPNYQRAAQAMNETAQVILRWETGAAAPVHEVRNMADRYSPQFGDSAATIKQKREALAARIESARRLAGVAAGPQQDAPAAPGPQPPAPETTGAGAGGVPGAAPETTGPADISTAPFADLLAMDPENIPDDQLDAYIDRMTKGK